VYSNKSDKNNDITTIVVDAKWAQDKHLESANVTLTHYEELKELTIEAKQLVKLCKAKINEINKVYKMYLDN